MASAQSLRGGSDSTRRSHSKRPEITGDRKHESRNDNYDLSKQSYDVDVGEAVQVFSTTAQEWFYGFVTELLEDDTGKYVHVEWRDIQSIPYRKVLHVQSENLLTNWLDFRLEAKNGGSLSRSSQHGSQKEKDPQGLFGGDGGRTCSDTDEERDPGVPKPVFSKPSDKPQGPSGPSAGYAPWRHWGY